jgi:hypothetical protein
MSTNHSNQEDDLDSPASSLQTISLAEVKASVPAEVQARIDAMTDDELSAYVAKLSPTLSPNDQTAEQMEGVTPLVLTSASVSCQHRASSRRTAPSPGGPPQTGAGPS